MRISYSDEEDVPGQFALWQANCRRSLQGKKGQAALRELEAALLALPEKRLIAERLQNAEGEVCALGAIAKHRGIDVSPKPPSEDDDDWYSPEDEDMEEFGVSMGMPRLVAWKVVAKNDVEIDGGYERVPGPYRWPSEYPQIYVPITPEVRYQKMLAWVQSQIQPTACASPLSG